MTTGITTGHYQLYGIIDAAADLPADLAADGTYRVLRRGPVAAVVAGPLDRAPRASRAALLDHARLLDRLALHTAVLPARFGTVLDGPDAVHTTLATHADDYSAALRILAGRVQYTVKVHHLREAVLREIVAEQPEVARLRELLADETAGVGYYEQIRLGELVAQALAATCEADAQLLWELLTPYAAAAVPRVITSPETPFGGAFLVDAAHRAVFEAAVQELAVRWQDRARMRLLGPSAPYDFVASSAESAAAGR